MSGRKRCTKPLFRCQPDGMAGDVGITEAADRTRPDFDPPARSFQRGRIRVSYEISKMVGGRRRKLAFVERSITPDAKRLEIRQFRITLPITFVDPGKPVVGAQSLVELFAATEFFRDQAIGFVIGQDTGRRIHHATAVNQPVLARRRRDIVALEGNADGRTMSDILAVAVHMFSETITVSGRRKASVSRLRS